MESGQKAQAERTGDEDNTSARLSELGEKATDSDLTQRPSLNPRSSLESTATTLPRYSEAIDRPPTYNPPARRPNNATRPNGASAAALSAIMATGSSDTDKMHSKRSSKKVDDWNQDDTYKGKLSRMTGSTSKWNYFGADIEQYGNPFKGFRRKK